MLRYLLSLIIIFSVKGLLSQPVDSDFESILHSNYHNLSFEKKRKISYVFKDRNALVKYNPVSLSLGGLLFFYQSFLSPQLSAGCAFDISCSNFSKNSIKQFGILKGVALSADRLTRCNRISSADYHPVLKNKEGKMIDHPDMYSLKNE
jgi:putative component of membrane protein insertase Oxa1/YidC/SpoIIIJ protein YidD